MNNVEPFSPEFIARLVQEQLPHETSIKLMEKDKATPILAELIKLFIAETAARAAKQTLNEDAAVCEIEHVSKILPQLLLDF